MYLFKNRIWDKIIFRIYFMLVILDIFCILILTACSNNVDHQNKNYCSINRRDNLEYFDCFNKKLSSLYIPNYLNISIFNLSSADYSIPVLDSNQLIISHKKYFSPSICPPVITEDIYSD